MALDSLQIAAFIDARFSTNVDYSSQLRFVVRLLDANGDAKNIHYSSFKSKRITRSVFAAELYAMLLGFDHGFVIHKTTVYFLGQPIPLQIYTDSRGLFDVLTTLNIITEKES